ncbi:DUF421 domain-containing protein [Flavobacterium sp.]|uniref:DUF421 domain-containing protein n=1 Tax=Flavobacterium sp. TaxID=239 RepID=UPI00121C9701|nr:YetF domain-containing protein [Flavobacterium sp.]RZJ73511.1 MAG: DUF421 domain-containing protein [Flavobacterium sp.]
MQEWFIKDWESILRVCVCAVISFVTLFVFIRISGKRTLSKLNAFDFVVSVSMGSTLSSMILGKVTLSEGCVALLIIIALQFALARMAQSSKKMETALNSEPTLLFYNGIYLKSAMEKEMITEAEILSEIRKFRIDKISDVKSVVLELNGELTVVKKSDGIGKTSTDEFLPLEKP